MEIERKWMVNGWPEGLPLKEEFAMRQGYISVRPTVRIREEALAGGKTDYVLCFKSEGGLPRTGAKRRTKIPCPAFSKTRRSTPLSALPTDSTDFLKQIWPQPQAISTSAWTSAQRRSRPCLPMPTALS